MSSTLIFLHGGPGFKDYLEPYFSSLAPKFKCVFFDQVRGSTVRLQDQLKQLETIVENEKNSVVLVGHSWGGVLATEYALRHPDKLAGIVLISTGLRASQWKDEFRSELKRLDLEEATPEQIFLTEAELELGKPLLDETWKGFSGETFDSLSSTYLKDYDLTSTFRQIKVPILNIYGGKDVRFPPRVTKSFRNLNSRVEDVEIENAGHFPFLLEPNRKRIQNLIIERFLS